MNLDADKQEIVWLIQQQISAKLEQDRIIAELKYDGRMWFEPAPMAPPEGIFPFDNGIPRYNPDNFTRKFLDPPINVEPFVAAYALGRYAPHF